MPSVRGSFRGAARRPFVNAQVLLPRLGVAAELPLLVDTGADTTTIHWSGRELLETTDGRPLPADTTFQDGLDALGIGGARVRYGGEDAVLVFDTEQGGRRTTRIRVHIEMSPSPQGVPSLLGRDVLSEARLDFNMPADDLVLEWES